MDDEYVSVEPLKPIPAPMVEEKMLLDEKDAMQIEKLKLENEQNEMKFELVKERTEKEALAAKVAELEKLLRQMASSSPPAPPTSPPAGANEGGNQPTPPSWSSPPSSEGIANANRDEARKCLDIASCAFIDGDLAKAERFALKAQGMHQSVGVAELLTKIKAAKPLPPSLEDRVAKLELMGDAALKRLIKLERLYAGETQDLKDAILSDIHGNGNHHAHQTNKTPRRMMKLYDRLDNDSSSFLQWLFGAVVNHGDSQARSVFGQPTPPNPSVVSFVNRLRQNPLFAGGLRSILADYIKDHSEIIVFCDHHDTQVFASMNPSNGQGSGEIQVRRQGSSIPFQTGPFKSRFQPKDAWFIRFLEKLRDAGLLQDTASPLGLFNKVIQVDTFNASVRLYFKSA